jgi:molybdate transport system permease protein
MAGACPAAPLPLTFAVIAWSTGLLLVLGCAIGWLLARCRFPGRGLLDALVTLPMIFPPIVLGYGLLLLLGQQGYLVRWLPAALRPEIVFSVPGLVIAAFVAGLPMMVKPAQAAFAEIPAGLRDAAATLGDGPLACFFRVELPLARRGIAAGLILAASRGVGEIGLSLMLGGNIVGRTETLSLAIYNQVFDGRLDCANQLSLVLIGIASLAFFLLKRFGAL